MIGHEQEILLIEELKNGSYEAFDALYMSYSPVVERFAYAILKNRQEVDDLSQNIFLKIWEIRSSLCDVRSFRSYLFAMVRNAVVDILSRRKVVLCSDEFSERILMDIENVNVLERLDAHNLILMINIAVSTMPEQRRKVFSMSREKNMTHKEIADALGISVKTVEYHISKALSTLREMTKILTFFI